MERWGRGTLRAAGPGPGDVSPRRKPVASSVCLSETEKVENGPSWGLL